MSKIKQLLGGGGGKPEKMSKKILFSRSSIFSLYVHGNKKQFNLHELVTF